MDGQYTAISSLLYYVMYPLREASSLQAITAGKRVRSETSISSGAVSVSSAAAELCQMKLPSHDFSDARVAIVGAGKMSTLLVKHLQSKVRNRHRLFRSSRWIASILLMLNIKYYFKPRSRQKQIF